MLNIVYSNGEEYDVNCDGIDSEDGIVPPIAETCGYAGRITVDYYCWDNTVNFTVDYCYASYEDGWYDNTISADYSVKQVADPHTIVRCEVTKLPNRVFTEPLYTCLLYKSDAADERSSVDLCGRRVIKKKKRDASE